MYRRGFWGVALLAVLVIGLLFGVGSAIYRDGWSQGYLMGQLAAQGSDGAQLYGYPVMPYGQHSALGGLGLLLAIGLAFFLIVAVGKPFFFHHWRTAGGPWTRGWKDVSKEEREAWVKRWHQHGRHMPPWCWGEPAAEGAETGGAETADTPQAEG